MAGAVVRYVKSLYPTRLGVSDLITIIGLPVAGYLVFQQKKQLDQIREEKRLVNAELRARGITRDY